MSYRSGKFIRRNALALAASGAVILALSVGAAAALHQAQIASRRFEQVRKLAHTFVFEFGDELAKIQGSTSLREKMVRTAMEYLDSLATDAGADVEFQKELAAAYEKVGDAQGFPTRPNLGHTLDAVETYRKAAAIHERILARDPNHQRAAGAFYLEFANLLRLNGNFEEGLRYGNTALENLRKGAKVQNTNESIQMEIIRALTVLGDIDEENNRNTLSSERFQEANGLATTLLARRRDRETLMLAQIVAERLGTSAVATGRLSEALAAFDDTEKYSLALLALEPNHPRFRRNIALLAQFRSTAYLDDTGPSLNDPARCLEHSRAYLENVRLMVAKDPNNASARLSHAIALFRISFPLRYTNPAAAVASAQESLQIFDAILAQGKPSYLVLSRRTRAIRRLAEALLAAGRLREAKERITEAVASHRQVFSRNEKDLREAGMLVMALLAAGKISDALQDYPGAEALLTEGEKRAAGLYDPNAPELSPLVVLARARELMTDHWRLAGNEAQAQVWLEKERTLWREFPRQNDFVRKRLAMTEAKRTPSVATRR